jgi:hypothetical protein
MKTTLKTLTVLGLICSVLNTVQAEEAPKKTDASKGAFQMALEDFKDLPDDINAYIKSKVDVPLTKTEQERSNAMLGHLVSTAQKHLTEEEKEQMRQLISKGWERKTLKNQEAVKS